MHLAKGILTSTGGKASHAAVVARGWGKPCVVGCEAMKIDEARRRPSPSPGKTVKAGDFLTINGTTGDVMIGKVPTVAPTHDRRLRHADDVGRQGPQAEDPHQRRHARRTPPKAREFGAEGIGLCRTEHMFFGDDRIAAVREMILADDEEGRKTALAKIEPFQKADFVGIFEAMDGLPGHHPPARPAAARVPAAERQRARSRGRQADSASPSRRSASGSRNCTR